MFLKNFRTFWFGLLCRERALIRCTEHFWMARSGKFTPLTLISPMESSTFISCFNFPSAEFSRQMWTLTCWSGPLLWGSGCHFTFMSQMAMFGTDGTLTTLCIFGSMPLFFESSTLLGRATLQGLVIFDHVNLHIVKILEHFAVTDFESILTFACLCICHALIRLWHWCSQNREILKYLLHF